MENEIKVPEKITATEIRIEETNNREKKETVLDRIIQPPHTKISREVVESDITRIVDESKVLYEICYTQDGVKYFGALAMAHPQINSEDPLRLFVTAEKEIIINPVIKRHTNYTVDSEEGCVSFPGKARVKVQRWHKIEVEYQTIMVDPEDKNKFKLSSIIEEGLSGLDARCFQHEYDHLDAKYIYPLEENDEHSKAD